MKTHIKILGAIYTGLSVLLAAIFVLFIFSSVFGRNAPPPIVIGIGVALFIWFYQVGTGLWRLRPGAWLSALIVAGVFMLALNSVFLFGGGGWLAASTGRKIFHLSCIAVGIYSLVILLLPKGQAVFHPKLPPHSDKNLSPKENAVEEDAVEKESEQTEVYSTPKIVFEEKLSSKNKLYLIGVFGSVIALAGAMSFGAGQAGLYAFGALVLSVAGLAFALSYVSYSGARIVCDDEGFQVSKTDTQRRRIAALTRGSIGLFVVSLTVLIVVMNFFNPPGPPSALNLVTILGCCVGIVLGIAGFLLGKNMDLTTDEKTGRRRFGWRQVTDTQIFPVDENDNFIFSVRVDDSEVLSFPSGARGFRNLLRVFNENAAHLPFLWVDEETINRREIMENVGERYFKIRRREN